MKKLILLFVFLFIYLLSSAQYFVPLTDATGVGLDEETIASLEEIATDINENFTSDNQDFKIYYCGFYAYYDLMGDPIAPEIWHKMKKEVYHQSNGGPYILFGKQYDSKENRYKFKVDVNLSGLKCKDDGYEDEIRKNEEKIKEAVLEYVGYLNADNELQGGDVVKEVSELLMNRLQKTCCGFYRGDYCDIDIDKLQIRKKRDQIYYILSMLSCAFNETCENDLRNYNGPQLVNYGFDQIVKSDEFSEELGISFIKLKVNDNGLNSYICNEDMVAVDSSKYMDLRNITNRSSDYYVDVDIFHFLKFNLIVPKGVNIINIIKDKAPDLNEISSIIQKVKENKDLNDDDLIKIRMLSGCLIGSLDDLGKMTLLKWFISKEERWYDFGWRQEYFTQIVIDLYDTIDKEFLFSYFSKRNNLLDIWHFVRYDYYEDLKEEFLHKFVLHYHYYLLADLSRANTFEIIPYETDKWFGFVTSSHNFEVDKTIGQVVVTKPKESKLSYDALFPVVLVHTDLTSGSIDTKLIPGIMLAAMTEDESNENFWQGVAVAIDVASILVGGYGIYASVGRFAITVASIELGAGVGNMIVRNTDLIEDPETKKNVTIVLTLFEFSSLGVTASTKVKSVMRKYASKSLKGLSKETKLVNAEEEIRIMAKIAGKQGLIDKFKELGLSNLVEYISKYADDSKNWETAIERFHLLDEDPLRILNDDIDKGLYSSFTDDLIKTVDDQGIKLINTFNGKPGTVRAWEIVSHRGYQIRRSAETLESLLTLRNNANLSSKLIGKTQEEIDVLLGNMKGWSGASYKQVCDKVNELVDNLPENVTNFDKYLGSAGFGNANKFTNRHSWVQLERLLANKNKLNIADEIVFERQIQNVVNGTNYTSFTDVYMRIGSDIYEIETKAGIKFFENVASNSSNFAKQSFNSLTNVNKLENYKVFLNPTTIAQLDNATVLTTQKNNVINAWKNWEGGALLKDVQIRNKFTEFARLELNNPGLEVFADEVELEAFLSSNDSWFNIIFKENLPIN